MPADMNVAAAMLDRRLLLVDDDSVDRERICRLIARSGLTGILDEAVNGAEALAMVTPGRYCAVLLDYRLPDAIAIELMPRLQARAGSEELPVIILTRMDDVQTAVAVMKQGAYDYLVKDDLQAQTLRTAVEGTLARSALRATERALSQSEARLRTITDSVPALIAYVDREQRIRFANQVYAKWLGLDPHNLIGKTVREVFGEIHFAEIEPWINSVLAGRSVSYRRVMEFAGASRYLQTTYIPDFNAAGAVIGYHVLAYDVTEQARQEERIQGIVELAPNGMVMVDAVGRIVLSNFEIERMFGYTRQELVGQSIDMLMVERFRSAYSEFRAKYLASGREQAGLARSDIWGRRKDGSEFPAEIGHSTIETYEGTMVLSAITDITERKAALARTEAALKEKTVLLNEIHHRVKNNLNVVASLLDLQANQTQNAETRQALTMSQGRVNAMALIHQLLYERSDFSRLELGRYLQGLADLLLATYQVDPSRVKLSLQLGEVYLELQRAVPCGLYVNEIVTNSLKHAFPGGRSGQISISLSANPDGLATLLVSDDGVGLPDGLDPLSVNSLGLQLVPLLAEQVQGKLTIRGKPGTCFELTFTAENKDQHHE